MNIKNIKKELQVLKKMFSNIKTNAKYTKLKMFSFHIFAEYPLNISIIILEIPEFETLLRYVAWLPELDLAFQL